MRGQASAIYLFVITLVGLGVGPTADGLGDRLRIAMTTRYAIRC
jgi:hypothetical protein